jgi:hypothetical protein
MLIVALVIRRSQPVPRCSSAGTGSAPWQPDGSCPAPGPGDLTSIPAGGGTELTVSATRSMRCGAISSISRAAPQARERGAGRARRHHRGRSTQSTSSAGSLRQPAGRAPAQVSASQVNGAFGGDVLRPLRDASGRRPASTRPDSASAPRRLGARSSRWCRAQTRRAPRRDCERRAGRWHPGASAAR